MKRSLAAALCVVVLAPAAAFAADSYDILGKDGSKIGQVKLTGAPQGTLIDIELVGGSLTPGRHGLHFHQSGDCSDVGQYKKSGSHVGHAEGKHGLLNPNGPEPGDLPNLVVAQDGSAQVNLFTSLVKIDELKDQDGSALIIHANEDDQISQPIGKAGDRVACASIK
ncbi:superoxide dismutase family protein [Hansschlegelia beijingensis]|uniref:Cu-Zn family superoxide dismutase n=1 Tax=Hansschlegelia beijingensis TaxID=1133344 RepID=A0A7W6GGN1_9HYPH|nr:superoxide dismutase family protein [Hansschlegelia beijingensis]MBB3974495.1 Cu-Zn family superoxide dismutase [Hansschlegelia beijingensis]